MEPATLTFTTWDSREDGPSCRGCGEAMKRGHRYALVPGGDAYHFCCWERLGETESEPEPAAPPAPPPAPVDRPTTSRQVHGPRDGDLRDGETRSVPGSRGRSYEVKRVGDVYSCSCPAWRFQAGRHPSARSCKHLIALRGADAEAERVEDAEEGTPEETRPERAPEGRTEIDDDGREYEFEEDDDE